MIALARDTARDGAVAIRPWTLDDAEAVHAAVLASAEHLAPRMPWVGEWTRPDCDPRAVIAPLVGEWERHERYHGGIYVDGRLVGSVGLVDRVGPGAIEVGYWLTAAETGRGYATIGTALACDLAFTDPAVERLVILHDVSNEASAGVARRLGFVDLGTEPGRPELRAPADTGVERRWERRREEWTGVPRRG